MNYEEAIEWCKENNVIVEFTLDNKVLIQVPDKRGSFYGYDPVVEGKTFLLAADQAAWEV